MKRIKAGVIGLGGRGRLMLRDVLLCMDAVEVTYVCDVYPDRAEEGRRTVENKRGYSPKVTEDYREVVSSDEVDTVFIFSAWESHIPIAIEAMRAGKPVGMEVGGAYTLDQCFDLVKTYSETGIHCMMLENCCYGRDELTLKNMVKQGLFGELVYLAGGYHHDLREEISTGEEKRHYRLRNYKYRNCENYPTHELGPICKLLGINRGNRMVSLRSLSTKAVGLNDYARKKPYIDPDLRSFDFAQGDIVTTLIECSGGQNIILTLDTTLPRAYSRGLVVRGTNAAYSEWENSIFIDGVHNKYEFSRLSLHNNFEEYRQEYEHKIWRDFINDGVRGGHGGMDWLVIEAFLEYASGESPVPAIDTYDTAAWMAITPLSERSISLGGSRVEVPDFTEGEVPPPCTGAFSLE